MITRDRFHDLIGNLEEEDVRVALIGGSYELDPSAKMMLSSVKLCWADLMKHEASGPGYEPGGQALTGKRVVFDEEALRLSLFADDPYWVDSSIKARFAVVYVNTYDPQESPVLTYVDFKGPQESINGLFRLMWAEKGVLTVSWTGKEPNEAS